MVGFLKKDIVVDIKSISFSRGSRLILDDVSITIPRGKITAIIGPSGCGKTTLLKIIGGQIIPDSGQVLINGKSLKGISRHNLYKIRRQIGVLFQSGALFSDMSVFDNVAFPLREHTNLSEAMIRDLVLIKLNAVGLRGAHNLMPTELSGGMNRRVALARTIALDPALIMYDEPFTGQDPISKGVLVKLIKLLNGDGSATSIIISHDIQDTLQIADYVYLITNGKVVGYGKPDELLASGNDWVQQFINGYPDGPVSFHYPAIALAEDLYGSS